MKNVFKLNRITLLLAGIILLSINACKDHDDHDHDHDHDHENELITTVRLRAVAKGTTDTLSFAWRQPAGPGTAITIDTILLDQGKTYDVFTEVLDESKTPVFNVTNEIRNDANSHRFIYTSDISNVLIQIMDFDTQTPAMELGLHFTITTPDVMGTGKLNCVLKHYTSSDPKTNGVNAGSSDIEVQFPLLVN